MRDAACRHPRGAWDPHLRGLPVLLLLAVAEIGTAQDVRPEQRPDGREARLRLERVEAHLTRLDGIGFSGAVGVVQQGRVALMRGLGMADHAALRPFEARTAFFVASLSKQFTAALVLALEARGQLRVQDTIGTYLADVPRAMSHLTIHHLLTHTSGLDRLDDGDQPLRNGEDAIRAAFRAGIAFAPGTRFDYSNAGYAFLAAIAERVGGRSYEELIRELLFDRAGMTRTNMVTEGPITTAQSVAVGYNGFIPHGPAYLRRPYDRALIGPAGVVTTMEDMLRWELALRDGRSLPAASLRAMFTPGLENYGYGWSIWSSPRAGERVAAHDGHIMPEGFNAYYIRLLDSDAAVIVFANRGDVPLAERVAWQIVDLLSGRPAPPLPERAVVGTAPPPASLYASANGARLRLHRVAERAYLEPLNQAAANLFLENPAPAALCAQHMAAWLAVDTFATRSPLGATLAAARAEAARLGPYRGHEFAYCVQEDVFQRAHLRHFVGSDTLYTRVDMNGAALVGGTDAGAFISRGRGLTPSLARLAMVPVAPGSWVVFDLWGGVQRQASLVDGRLTVWSSGQAVTFAPAATQ